jgi:hypothetical protein
MSSGDHRVGREQAQILVRAGGHGVVVPGPDVHITPELIPSRRTTSVIFAWTFRIGEAVDDVYARLLE